MIRLINKFCPKLKGTLAIPEDTGSGTCQLKQLRRGRAKSPDPRLISPGCVGRPTKTDCCDQSCEALLISELIKDQSAEGPINPSRYRSPRERSREHHYSFLRFSLTLTSDATLTRESSALDLQIYYWYRSSRLVIVEYG